MPALEAELGIPIYDSTVLAVWKALRLCGVDTRRGRRWGRLFELRMTARSSSATRTSSRSTTPTASGRAPTSWSRTARIAAIGPDAGARLAAAGSTA